MNWRPSASFSMLRRRAALLRDIRAFMDARSIMEVETPALSRAGATDIHIESLRSAVREAGSAASAPVWLHTSPEFPMKRLLSAGSGPIYQLARVFRDGEGGGLHQPEFTMLEWYRPGFNHHALMDEVSELMEALGLKVERRIPYAQAFLAATGLDPHSAATPALMQGAEAAGFKSGAAERTVFLDFLFGALVAPAVAGGAILVYDFPAEQAALARIRKSNPPVAERFELLVNGIEIANGFHELADVREQRARFEADNLRRAAAGLPVVPVDENLLAALEAGLPDCAGVAVGVDRLLMVLEGRTSLEEVLAFPHPGA